MKNKKLFSILAMAMLCVFSFLQTSSAELYVSRKGLFKIDVPEGWQWIDNSDTVIILSMQQEGTIIMKMQPQPEGLESKEQMDKFLDKGMESMIEKAREQKGIIAGQKSRTLDGVNAEQVNFLLNEEEGKLHATFIAALVKGYFLTIYMEGPQEPERAKMEKIIEGIKFLGR